MTPSSTFAFEKSKATKATSVVEYIKYGYITGTEHSRLALTQSTLHRWYHYGPLYYRKAYRCTQSTLERVNKLGDKRNVSS